jgi:hypothetical protein
MEPRGYLSPVPAAVQLRISRQAIWEGDRLKKCWDIQYALSLGYLAAGRTEHTRVSTQTIAI